MSFVPNISTVIHSIAFAQNTFFFKVKTEQLPVFLLSALSYCSAQWVVGNSSELVTTPYLFPLVPYPNFCANFEFKVSENKMYLV